ncbi:PaaI family thioesterase [soil metagenome]
MDDAAPTPDDERRRLVEEARRLVRGTRVTTVGDTELQRATALLAEAAAILEQQVTPGPFWQTGLESFDQFDLSTDPREIFPFSPATGPLNPISPKVTLDITDERTVVGHVTFAEAHNGPPFDTAHGGVIALVYDDLLGMAAMVGAGGGMTGRLTINYRKPTPMFVPIELKAWMSDHEGRKFVARGEMTYQGELLTEADGLFIRPRGFLDGSAATG